MAWQLSEYAGANSWQHDPTKCGNLNANEKSVRRQSEKHRPRPLLFLKASGSLHVIVSLESGPHTGRKRNEAAARVEIEGVPGAQVFVFVSLSQGNRGANPADLTGSYGNPRFTGTRGQLRTATSSTSRLCGQATRSAFSRTNRSDHP